MGDALDEEFFDRLIVPASTLRDGGLTPGMPSPALRADLTPGVPSPPLREGLPPGYRMRHDAHYVDQFAQPALPQVRMIPLSQIDGAAPQASRDLTPLVSSISRFGLLQPLLVRRHDGRYDLLSGSRRLAAARAAGLVEVPCLLYDADEARAAALRQACKTQVTSDDVAAARPSARVSIPAAAVTEVSRHLESIRSCLNLLGDRDRSLYENVAITLVGAEIQRAVWFAEGLAVLAEDPVLDRTAVNIAALVRGVVDLMASERTLSASQVTTLAEQRGAPAVQADPRLLSVAFGGALVAMLSLAERAKGTQVRCTVRTERERGEVIVEMSQHGVTLPASRLARFFDLGWSDRPGGYLAGVGAVAARRIVELHAGTAEAAGGDEGGCTLRLELPFEQP